MKRKQFIRLSRELMLRINDGTNPDWPRGPTLKRIEGLKIGQENGPAFKSYQEAWDSLHEVRKLYGMK